MPAPSPGRAPHPAVLLGAVLGSGARSQGHGWGCAWRLLPPVTPELGQVLLVLITPDGTSGLQHGPELRALGRGGAEGQGALHQVLLKLSATI